MYKLQAEVQSVPFVALKTHRNKQGLKILLFNETIQYIFFSIKLSFSSKGQIKATENTSITWCYRILLF